MAEQHRSKHRATAHAWRSLLDSGEATDADREAFAVWMSASEEHASAFEQAESSWASLGFLRRDLVDEAMYRPSGWDTIRLRTRRLLGGFGRIYGQPVTAAALLLVIGVTLSSTVLFDKERQIYSTQKSETKTFALNDGTSITLSAATSVVITYSDRSRQALLEDGAVFFDIEPDGRPFLVRTRQAKVEVTGTAFEVAAYAKRTQIAVEEGTVSVSSESQSHVEAQPVVELRAGQGVSARLEGVEAPHDVQPGDLASWRTSRLSYQGVSLADVVADANRYLDTPFTLSSPGLADLTVTASFELDNLEQGIRNLQFVMPVTISEYGWISLQSN